MGWWVAGWDLIWIIEVSNRVSRSIYNMAYYYWLVIYGRCDFYTNIKISNLNPLFLYYIHGSNLRMPLLILEYKRIRERERGGRRYMALCFDLFFFFNFLFSLIHFLTDWNLLIIKKWCISKNRMALLVWPQLLTKINYRIPTCLRKTTCTDLQKHVSRW